MMNKLTKIVFALSVFVLTVVNSNAQIITVKGTVVDNAGLPIIAATVYEKGNVSNGVTSDQNGNWSLSVSGKSSIIFSCLGYQDAEEAVKGRTVINVTLQDDKLALNAAQVVTDGYTSVAKRDLTGSVSSMSMDDVVKSPVTSFDQALTGRIAGVVVTTTDGSVGKEANIIIRGNNSLTQSSAPLYIIDGFPSESSMATNLNSADIETIDILKDASATAIYGARGANGVIVITTKKGAEGKPTINFTAAWTGNVISNKVSLMNTYDFVRLQTDMYAISGGTNKYLENGHTLEEYKNAATIDWQDRIYRPALVQNYSLSLSGGNKSTGTNYNIGFSALDQDGIIVNSNFQRYQGKINLSQKVSKRLTANVMVNYSKTATNGTNPTAAQQSSSATGWLMYSVWGYRPARPLSQTGSEDEWLDALIDADASGSNDYRFNPAKTVRNEYRKIAVDYMSANLSLIYKFTDNLSLKASGAYTTNKRRTEAFNGSQTYTGYEGSPSGKGINGHIYWNDKSNWLNDYVLTYSKTLAKKHHLQLIGIYSMQGESADFYGTRAEKMTTEQLGLKGLHTGQYQTVTPFRYDWRMMSGAFRLNYNYKYKYYLTASFRADASSKFPKANRVGYFPSASIAWNFNREDFLKNRNWLSNGKLRFSWGLTGNNRTSTPYDFYPQISTLPGTQQTFDYVFDGKNIAGYYPSNLANPNLKWETTAQIDAGIDLGFFNDRIKIIADWYRKDTRDLLLEAIVPASSGYTTEMRNIGSMRNTGFEFSLETVNVKTRNFEWDMSFNIAFNRNMVTALNDNQYSLFRNVSWEQRFNSQFPYLTQVGKPSGMMYGFIYEGTYKKEDFNDMGLLKNGIPYMNSVGRGLTKPGDAKYADINGDGVIDDNDRTIIGCGQPLHTGGFGNTFYYKGFDLNFFMQWSYGNSALNANRLIFENGSRLNLNQFNTYNNRFDETNNPNSDIPRLFANGMDVYSSRVVEDASFLRLRNITLGYTMPARFMKRLRIDNARVYFTAENIWTLTNYSGPDPEVSTRNSVLTPGFDWSAYPRAFGFTGGISLTF
ncbi:MAG: SusC/RagA family TonB-linked outer membrane protein [Candidatus Cryptobacteroides sp.]